MNFSQQGVMKEWKVVQMKKKENNEWEQKYLRVGLVT